MSEPRPDVEKPARLVADGAAIPAGLSAGVDPRFVGVWCAFLDRLAIDAEAALAAAIAYRELDPAARDTWLAALEQDVDRIGVPRVAVYAPLLAVEADAARLARIASAMGPVHPELAPQAELRALSGTCGDGARVAIVVAPLYLRFVRVLACKYRLGEHFEWVRHDPIVEDERAPKARGCFQGTPIDVVPLKALVDDLAITVVAHRRTGRPVPEALTVFADLFGPSAYVG